MRNRQAPRGAARRRPLRARSAGALGQAVSVAELLAAMPPSSAYELRILLDPSREDGGHESRPYETDLDALDALVDARVALGGDRENGLSLLVYRDDCLVYEWTELRGAEYNHLEVGHHRRRGCSSAHSGLDVFDILEMDIDFAISYGFRAGGSHAPFICPPGCARTHGDLHQAMFEYETRYLSSIHRPDAGRRREPER